MKRAVGFDVGGSTVRAGLVELGGAEAWRLVAERREPLEAAGKAPAALVATIARLARELAGLGAEPAGPPPPVGVGLCAQLTADARRAVNAPNLGWRDVEVAALLEAALPRVRVRLDNDLNAILLGEQAFGAARGCRDVVAVFPGTGIGGAVMVDGRLVRGAHGFAGEVGHVWSGGAMACGCGQVGCAETRAGGTYIEARVAADQVVGRAPAGLRADSGPVRASDVDAAYRQGEPYAVALWGEVVDVLAGLAATGAALLDPEMILLGGGVVTHCPGLTAALRAEIGRRAPAAIAARLRIELAALGWRAGVLGAALAAAA
jgi:glucokinase